MLCRSVYEEPSQKECLSVAADWLTTCLNEHEKCSRATHHEKPLPTRVIDVGAECISPKLLTSHGKIGTWIALSYCWGGDSTFIHNDKTVRDLENGIPLIDYPATLRDAIIITRALGIKYIWIDALCIKQDSVEDWVAEAAKMREVYSDAVLTITAANSPTTRTGIFSKRKFEFTPAKLEWRTPTGGSTVSLRSGSELWDHSLQMSALQTRGWTLQEGVLAPRTLSYGAQQMIWECAQYQADEGGRTTRSTQDYRSKGFIQQLIREERKQILRPRHNMLEKLGLKSRSEEEWWKSFAIANPYDKWNDICEQFMARSLTKDYDVLPALAGIARVFQSVLNDDYCAGLWKNDILPSLAWRRNPRYPADNSTRFDLARPSEYLAPSWSWTSILGKLAAMSSNWKTRDALKTSASRTAKVVNVSTTQKNADPFGRVTRGELILRTHFCLVEGLPPVYSADNEFLDDTVRSHSKSPFQRMVFNTMRDVDEDVYEFYQQHQPHPNQHFAVVELMWWDRAPGSLQPGMDFLILESTGRKEDEYRRIGHSSLRKNELPNRESVGGEAYAFMAAENEAYEEVVKARWKKRTVTIV